MRLARRHPWRSSAGVTILALFAIAAAAADWIAPLRATATAHLLGIDVLGRDVFVHVVHGARTAVVLGALVAAAAVVAGGGLGVLAGVRGGIADSFIERIVEAAGVFPSVVLVALLRGTGHATSGVSLGLVVALSRTAAMTRLVRGLVLASLAEPWALAARATGVGPMRFAIRHLGPHLFTPVVAAAIFSVAEIAATEAALSFLGLGMPAAAASWGDLLGQVRFGAGANVLVPPALCLALLLMGAHLLADGLDEACIARGPR